MLPKIRLTKAQLIRISEVLGNISVAWFSAGVITPIFIHPQSVFDFIYTLVVSLILSGASLILSLVIIRKLK